METKDTLYIGGEWVAPSHVEHHRGDLPRHRRGHRPRARGRRGRRRPGRRGRQGARWPGPCPRLVARRAGRLHRQAVAGHPGPLRRARRHDHGRDGLARRAGRSWARCSRRRWCSTATPTSPARTRSRRSGPARSARCSCARSRSASRPASSRGTCRCSSWPSSSAPPWPPARRWSSSRRPRRRSTPTSSPRCLDEVGLPEGWSTIVAAGREVGEYLVRHPGVDKVGFTGSTAAGRKIGAICGEQLKRCTLELGGKSAAIVLDDADLDARHPDAHARRAS